jgi:hypothetical protein
MVSDTKVGVLETHAGGSRQSSRSGVRDSSKPPTPRGLNVDGVITKLKVLKLQEKIAKLKNKLKSKKKVQEVSSSLSLNEEGNGSSSNDESIQAKKGKGNKEWG